MGSRASAVTGPENVAGGVSRPNGRAKKMAESSGCAQRQVGFRTTPSVELFPESQQHRPERQQ
jgi:hypothetical protein